MKGLIETSFYKHREISTPITVLSIFVFRTRRVIGRANQIVTCKMFLNIMNSVGLFLAEIVQRSGKIKQRSSKRLPTVFWSSLTHLPTIFQQSTNNRLTILGRFYGDFQGYFNDLPKIFQRFFK